jgi:glyoxylase-like metal-dependent hydrolase (beta-lactamase superfamily II)
MKEAAMRIPVAVSLLALALGACGKPGQNDLSAGASAAPTATPVVRLYALECGMIDVLDLSNFDRGGAYQGRTASLVDSCWLIRHPAGDLLWDTGLPDALNAAPEGVTDPPFVAKVPKTLKSGLADLGLQPSDIEFLSLSHSHFDHAGNAGEYASATVIVQKAERAHMFRPEARADAEGFAAYSALERAKTREIEGDHDVFGDGSAPIVATPGHNPGHSALLVNLKNSDPVILTGDLYHLLEAREKRTVPAFNTNAEETLRSMERFEALAAATGARVIIQHSPEHLAATPRPSAFLG